MKVFLTLTVLAITLSGCYRNTYIDEINNNSKYKNLYNDIKLKSRSNAASILSNRATRSDTISASSYPYLTSEDVRFLLSLDQNQFEELLDGFIIALRDAGIADISGELEEKYTQVFEFLGGEEGINRLLEFAESYLTHEEGWENIELYLPENLPEEYAEIYISMAIYIDNLARPIFTALVEQDFTPELMIPSDKYKDDNSYCKWELKQELKLAGINVAWEIFLDCMSGGTLTLIDADIMLANAYEIWLQYEVCNYRWH